MFQPRFALFALASSLAAAPSTAFAFEFGRRIRVPDWMDPYFVMLGLAMGVFFIAATLTKPRGVVLSEVDHAQMPFMPRFYYSAFLASLLIAVILFFMGSYIVRRDDFVEDRQQEQREVAAAIAKQLAESNRTKRPTLRFRDGDDLYELPAALADMTHVTDIRLVDSRVKDISVLAQMPWLEKVDVSGSKVTDLSPLSGLSNLTEVDAARTRVKDLSPLRGLSGLKVLDLGGSYVTDLTPIAGLKDLEVLKLARTDVDDISVLTGHPSLRLLEIQRTKVVDLRPALTWPAMQPHMAKNPDTGGLRFAFSAAAESYPALAAMTKGQPRARLGKLAAYYNVDWPIKTGVSE